MAYPGTLCLRTGTALCHLDLACYDLRAHKHRGCDVGKRDMMVGYIWDQAYSYSCRSSESNTSNPQCYCTPTNLGAARQGCDLGGLKRGDGWDL